MKIFLTGASGFIGGAVAEKLQEKHEIYGMARSEKSVEKLKSMGIRPVRTALNEVKIENIKGCKAVIHCAAFVEQWGSREQFWKTNVEGTRQLLEVARAAGVKRFIHLGTEAAFFYGQDMIDIDETYPYPKRSPFLYSETKREAEKLVLAANREGIFETISVRPRMVWGPGDQTFLPELKKAIQKGGFLWIDGGKAKTSSVYIDNLVVGIELALDKGKRGNAYFITDDEILTFREFFTQYLGTQGITPPNKNIPGWLARSIAFALESIWRTFGIKSAPPITRFAANVTSRIGTISIEKAKRELGYQPLLTVQQGMEAIRKE